MTKEQFAKLERGDIIQCDATGTSYVVDARIDGGVLGIRTVVAQSSWEWNLVEKPKQDAFEEWYAEDARLHPVDNSKEACRRSFEAGRRSLQ